MKLSTTETEDFQINIFDTDSSGVTVCIVGGVHGNEICGVKAIEKINSQILKNSTFLKGRLITIVANYKAIQQKKRFIDWDLNRAFGESDGFGHETYLAQKLTLYLRDVDYLIDLHSTSAPTKPFCAGKLTAEHLNLFSMTGVRIYTHGWELHRGHTMLIDEVDRWGGIGLIVECGKNDETNTHQVAYNVAWNVMSHLVMKKSMIDWPSHSNIIIKVEKIIKAKTNQFFFVRNFQSFDPVVTNEIIAYDNGVPLNFPYPYIMVMPNYRRLKQGDEAFGIGIV